MSRRDPMFKPLFTWRSAISTPDSRLTPTEHHVLLTLSLHMNELGASCYPSIETLAWETCGRSASTIREALAHADELGWLNRHIRGGRRRANEYEALIPGWYETRRDAAPLLSTSDSRRAAAIEAATAAHRPSNVPIPERREDDQTHRSPAGNSAPKPAAPTHETHRRDSENPPHSGPEVLKRTTRAAAAGDAASAAAALLDRYLEDLGVPARVRRVARAEPERAQAWLELAQAEAHTNPAAFFLTGFQAGEWPSPRKRQTAARSRSDWVAATSVQLPLEDAHAIVDDWPGLTDVERQELHEAVDRLRDENESGAAAA